MSPSRGIAAVALTASGAIFTVSPALAAPEGARKSTETTRTYAQGEVPTHLGADPSVPAPVSPPGPTPVESTPVPEAPPLSPPPERHDTSARLGPQLGVRVGYGVGSGVVYSGFDVSEGSHGAVPVIVDLGWRFIPELYAGVYGQIAPVLTRNNPISCPGNASCPAQDWRFGIQVDYHFLPHWRLDPYVGLGAGYEILHTHVEVNSTLPTAAGPLPSTTTAGIIDRGWEFGALTLGLDARVCSSFAIGPFVSASIAEYNVHSGTLTTSIVTPTGARMIVANTPVPDVHHGAHELYIFGVRGTFNL
jgi:hypothetical protein